MHEPDDMMLLREYAAHGSETAVAELVSRRAGFVYSAALRQVGDSHQAQEITQAVFVILVQKAGRISDQTNLTGWLFKTTRLVALAQKRAAAARRQREQEFHMQTETWSIPNNPLWELISPCLDEALMRLGEKDRQTVLLHYFDKKSFAEIGASLGMSEVTARKRASRAVEKLRKILSEFGVTSTATILASAMMANSTQAAPPALAKSVTAIALAKGATASVSTLTLIKGALKIMAWTKAKTAIVTGVAVLLAAGGGMAIYEMQQNPQKRTTSIVTDAPAEIKVNWLVGKKYELHMELNQSAETKSPGQPQPVEQGFKWTQDFNISVLKELPDGGRQLELEFVNEAIDESQAGHSVLSFDSAQSPAGNKYNRLAILNALVGARLEYFTDADGKVQTVEGINKLTDHIASVGTPQQQQVFNGMFSGDTLKRYLSLGDMMPNRTMNVGESWSVKRDVDDAIGILTVHTKLTFKNWEQHGDHKCAHIEEMSDISSKTVSTALGTMVKIEKGKISGDLWFDPELGMVVGGNSDEDLVLKITARTQTMTKQTHNKSRWTLVGVQ